MNGEFEKRPLVLSNIFGDSDFFCALTYHMDDHVKDKRTIKGYYSSGYTYLYDAVDYPKDDFEGKNDIDSIFGLKKEKTTKSTANIPIRYPGKTVGHITINRDYVIESVVIYQDNEDVYDIGKFNFSQFIGRKIEYKLKEKKINI